MIIEENFKFEVYPNDLNKMNWVDATKACDELGDGWRLPNRFELLIIHHNRINIGGFDNGFYWSSIEVGVNNQIWTQNFTTGSQHFRGEYYTFNVRPVRNLN
jgi:hypothetical protein